MQHLGRPLPNLVLLGAFAALTGLVGLVDVQAAAGERFQGAVLAGNCAAARQAYDVVKAHVGEGVGDAMAAVSAGAPVFDRKDADA
jgi:pyruvate ferredoxin oxidoreductase gamma subunit